MSEQDQAATAKKAAPAAKKAAPKNRAAKKAAPAAKKAASPDAPPAQHFEDPKVAVTLADPAGAARKAADEQEKKAAGEARASHVAALETELEFLQRQPEPKKGRIDEVKKQIDRFSKAPKNPSLETA